MNKLSFFLTHAKSHDCIAVATNKLDLQFHILFPRIHDAEGFYRIQDATLSEDPSFLKVKEILDDGLLSQLNTDARERFSGRLSDIDLRLFFGEE